MPVSTMGESAAGAALCGPSASRLGASGSQGWKRVQWEWRGATNLGIRRATWLIGTWPASRSWRVKPVEEGLKRLEKLVLTTRFCMVELGWGRTGDGPVISG